MGRSYICSSHTISGVTPGGPVASRFSFEERVLSCAAAGYAGMCIHFRDYGEQRSAGVTDDRMKALLHDHGMKHVSIEFLTDWFMDGEAGEIARRNERLAFDAARALGAASLNVGADMLGRGIAPEVRADRFRDLCGRARTEGLATALEIVPWSDVADVPTALEIIDGNDNAGLVIDAWHVFRGGVPLADIASLPAKQILCIQVNDAAQASVGPLAVDTLHRKLCGEGSFDLQGFMAALDSTGADIPISVEVISPELAALGARETAQRSLETARRSLDTDRIR